MLTSLVGHLVSLTVLFTVLLAFFKTIFDFITEGPWLSGIASAVLLSFWELIVFPLLTVITLPFLFAFIIIIMIAAIPFVALVLTSVATSVSPSHFHWILELAIGMVSSINRKVACFAASTAPVSKIIHNPNKLPLPDRKLASEPTLINHEPPTPPMKTETTHIISKRRRPINYSRSQCSIPLDRLDDTYARLNAHIVRFRSNNFRFKPSKEHTNIARVFTPTTLINTAVAPNCQNQVVDIVTSSPELIDSPVIQNNVATLEPNIEFGDFEGVNRQKHDQDNALNKVLPEAPETPPVVSDTECASHHSDHQPTDILETSTSVNQDAILPLSSAITYPQPIAEAKIQADFTSTFTAPHTEQKAPEPAGDITNESFTDPSGPRNTDSCVTGIKTSFDAPTSVISENQLDARVFTSYLTAEATEPNSIFTQTIPSSAKTESHIIPNDRAYFNSPPLDRGPPSPSVSDDILQGMTEVVSVPKLQEPQAGTEPFVDDFVEAPSILDISAPMYVDELTQLGFTYDPLGTNHLDSTLVPGPTGDCLSTVYMDHDPSSSSDADFLELAAATLAAEGMDWDLTLATPSASGSASSEDMLAQPPTDMELLELDTLLNIAGLSHYTTIPQTLDTISQEINTSSEDTLMTVPTDEEFLALAGAALSEEVIRTGISDFDFTDIDMNPANINTPFLDASQLQLLDQAALSIIDDLSNGILDLPGTSDSNEPTYLEFNDSASGSYIDPDELARMWSDFCRAHYSGDTPNPDVVGYIEEDIAQGPITVGVTDTACSSTHTLVNEACPPAIATSVSTLQTRKIKGLPLRRRAIENNARSLASQTD
ncbi:hypothetical protein RHS02_09889, partial [Rhizoctonia solani]